VWCGDVIKGKRIGSVVERMGSVVLSSFREQNAAECVEYYAITESCSDKFQVDIPNVV
jgi:hypothetical protein